MKKIYFVAVNWDEIRDTDIKDKYKFVITTEAISGNDIACFAEGCAYRYGWRIYPFTTKKARDEMVDRTLKGE